MARSLSVYMLHVKEPRKRKSNPWQQVDKLPDAAGDLLEFIKEAFTSVGDDDLVDSGKKKYVRVTKVGLAKGHPRVLQVDVESGKYGERGRNRDIKTHEEKHQYDGNEAPVVDLRLIFVVPKGARMALMFSERAHPQGASNAGLKVLSQHWMSQPWASEWSLKTEIALNVSAWLESAQVNEVRAVSYGHESDYEGLSNGPGQVLGDLTISLKPSKGEGHLRRIIWQLLREKPSERAKILGIEDIDDDIDEIIIDAEGANGQTKQFNIDRQKLPSIRIALGDLESDPQSPNHLVAKVVGESPGIYQTVGLEWFNV